MLSQSTEEPKRYQSCHQQDGWTGQQRDEEAKCAEKESEAAAELSCVRYDGLGVHSTQTGPGGTGYSVFFSSSHPYWEVFWPMAITLQCSLSKSLAFLWQHSARD